MGTDVTDDQIRQLVESAKPYGVALLWWGPERERDGADAIEREHQRRMVSLRADGVISILCPVGSDSLAGVAILDVSTEEAVAVLADDPCVQAEMIRAEVFSCQSFPGDSLPA